MSDEEKKPDALTRLIEEEDASAAIEFMVLVPVYILLMTGLFMFGNLVLARYTVVHGTRYVAWHPQTNSLSSSFPAIKPYPGTLSINGSGPSAVTIPQNKLQLQGQERNRIGDTSGLGRAQSKAQEIAKHVVNNESGTGKQMGLSEATGSFDYTGVSIGGMRITQQGAKAAVYLPMRYKRDEFQEGQAHPSTKWGGSQFDATTNRNAFFAPVYQQGGFREPDGIWDPRARIRGPNNGWRQELQFYKGKMP